MQTSFDILPCKNLALYELNTDDPLIYLYAPVFIKSREKGLITKECIVTDAHLNFVFKQALHFSTFVIKLFNIVTKLF